MTDNGYDPLGWQQAIDDFLAKAHGTLAAKTEQYYENRLDVLSAWAHDQAEGGQGVALDDFKAKHLRAFLAFRADHVNPQTGTRLAPSTRRHDAVAARVFFRFCARENYLPVDPLHGFVLPKAAKPYVAVPTEEHAQALMRACLDRWRPQPNDGMRYVPERRRQFFSRRNYAILTGPRIATGARVGEVLALTVEDYQPDQGRIVIRVSKGKEPRLVPVGEDWMGIVDSYLLVRPKACPTPFLFVTDEGNAMTPLLYRQQFYRDLEFARLPHYTLHSLRHYCLTRLAQVSVFGAQSVAGHKDLRVTRGYLHATEEHTRETMDRASPLGRLLGPQASPHAKRKRLI